MTAAKQQLLRTLLAEVPVVAGANGQGSASDLDDLPAVPGSPVESGLSRHLRWALGCISPAACSVQDGWSVWVGVWGTWPR